MTRISLVTIIALILLAVSASAQLKILTPAPGDSLHHRNNVNITWSGAQPNDTLVLQYSVDAGRTYRTITERATGGTFRWRVPFHSSDSCLLRLVRARTRHTTVMGTTTQPAAATPMALRSNGMIVATTAAPSGPRRPVLYSGGSTTPYFSLDSSFGMVGSMEFSPTGDTLMVCYAPRDRSNPILVFYDLRTNQIVQSFPAVMGAGSFLTYYRTDVARYSPSGDRVDLLSQNLRIFTYSIATGREPYQRSNSGYLNSTAAYSHDGRKFFVGNENGKIFAYQGDSDTRLFTLNFKQSIRSLAFSLDDSLFAVGGTDSLLSIYRSSDTSLVTQLKPHGSQILSIRFSADRRYLLTTSGDSDARIWDWKTQALIAVFVGHRDSVSRAEFTTDERQVVTSSYDGTTRIWPVDFTPEADTSDGYFKIDFYRPALPDTIRKRFAYTGPGQLIHVDTIRICNTSNYSITFDRTHQYPVSTAQVFPVVDAGPVPRQLKPDSCMSIGLEYSPAGPTDVENSAVAIYFSGEMLLVHIHIEMYGPSDAPDRTDISSAMRLHAVPNPVTAGTRFDCTVTSAGDAEITITDLLGAVVRTIRLGYLAPGSRSIDVDLSDLPSGLYRATLRTGERAVSTGIQVIR